MDDGLAGIVFCGIYLVGYAKCREEAGRIQLVGCHGMVSECLEMVCNQLVPRDGWMDVVSTIVC